MMVQYILSVTCWFTAITIALGVQDPYTECLNLLNIKEDDLHVIAVRDNTTLSDQSGEYFLCVWKIKNIIDEHGDVKVDNLKDFVKEELSRVTHVDPKVCQYVSEVIDACDLSSSEVHKETAIKVKNCHAKVMVDVLVPK